MIKHLPSRVSLAASVASILLLATAASAQFGDDRGKELLVKTVGTTPGVCSSETETVVGPGTTVYYCYSSDLNISETIGYNLTDDILGLIEDNGILPNSTALEVIIPSTIFTNVTNIAELFIYQLNATNPKFAVGNASATVIVDPSLPGGGNQFNPAIPTLSEIAMFSFGILLIAGAFFTIRKSG